jgi:hypothetical protein
MAVRSSGLSCQDGKAAVTLELMKSIISLIVNSPTPWGDHRTSGVIGGLRL